MRRAHNKINLDEAAISEQYNNGLTIAEIAVLHNVSAIPIRRVLIETGTHMRPAKPRIARVGELNPTWKGGRKVRKDGYILVWTPHGEKLEHRLVMEQKLGRPLLPSEVVHHIDENPSNNDPSNLELLASQSDHALLHGEEIRNRIYANGVKACTECKEIKPLTEYYKVSSRPNSYQSWCKKCKNRKDWERRKKGLSCFQPK